MDGEGSPHSSGGSDVVEKLDHTDGNIKMESTVGSFGRSAKNQSNTFANITIETASRPRDADSASEATTLTMSPVRRYQTTNNKPGSHDQHPIAEFWVRTLLNHKRPTAIVWILFAILGVFGSVRLVSNTTIDIRAPVNTDSYIAKEKFGEFFPEYTESSTFVLLYTRKDKADIVPDARLEEVINNLRTNVKVVWNDGVVQSIKDYYNYTAGNMTELAEHRLSKNHKYMIVTISIKEEVKSQEAQDFSNFLEKNTRDSQLTVQIIGAPVFEEEAEKAARDDIIHLLSAVTPITLVVMAFLLRSLRFILIGAVCLFVCSSISLGFCWLMSLTSSVSTMTPPLLLASVIGTSICYTLILLHRYREALLERRRNGLSLDKVYATKQALVHAGEAIVVSGVTLVVCFLGLTIYPMSSIRTLGGACGIGVTLVVLCSLSLSPLMLLVFRIWEGAITESTMWNRWDDLWHFTCVTRLHERFSDKNDTEGSSPMVKKPKKNQKRNKETHTVEDYDSDWNDSFREVVPHDKRAGANAAHNSLILKSDGINEMSLWLLWARITTKFPISLVVIVVIIGATMPLSIESTSFSVTADSMALVPHDSTVLSGYNTLGEEFTYGEVYPYSIVMVPVEGLITTEENWAASAKFLYNLGKAVNSSEGAQLNDVNFMDSGSITLGHQGQVNNLANLKACVSGESVASDCGQLLHAWQYVSADEKAMWALFTAPKQPMPSQGKKWLDAARKTTDDKFNFYISGEAAEVIDSMESVYSSIGLMVGVTTITIILFNLVAFKSVLIPLRALGTRAITVAAVYGAATIMYCDNEVSWSQSLSSKTNEISYQVILIALPILVGMGLGPDFLLMTRIIEIRKSSTDLPEYIVDPTRRAVVLGVTRTGDIISASGVVMTVCYVMLLVFSKVAIQNQVCLSSLPPLVFTLSREGFVFQVNFWFLYLKWSR